jgi:hypothetical protein
MMDDSGGTGFLGGVLVVLAVIAFVLYGGQGTGPKAVNLDLPAAAAPNSR